MLRGKTAMITGAGGGIGRALASAFVWNGANVVLTDVREDELKQTALLVGGPDSMVVAMAGDVTDAGFVQSCVDAAVGNFGRLDCAVNNAGVYPGRELVVEIPEDRARRTFDVDFWGVFYCMRAQINAMRASGGGSIVNVSSGAGLFGYPLSAVYCGAKHAVIGLTRGAALDHGTEGIRINAICPGIIETPQTQRGLLDDPQRRAGAVALHPIGRLGQPHEIADAAVWLCSDMASFVTGIALPVDGGFTAR